MVAASFMQRLVGQLRGMHPVTNVHHIGKDVSSVGGEALAKIWCVKESDRSAR